MERWQLQQRQSLDLDVKIVMSGLRIREFYEHMGGLVYVAFSGGNDSTALLHLVRRFYPGVKACFVNTGLEFPEIVRRCRNTENCEIIRPEKKFPEVIAEHGYPIVSKEQAYFIRQYRTTKSEHMRDVRWNGKGVRKWGKISEKWKFLVEAPFLISERCCYWLKKRPAKRYHKRTGLFPILGIMAADSMLRREQYLRSGCNILDSAAPQSRPIAFWTGKDVSEYLDRYGIGSCSVYDQGYEHTGCVFCGFGVHMEKEPNRFQRMKVTHPKLWRYCIDRLGMREVLDFAGVPYEGGQMELDL